MKTVFLDLDGLTIEDLAAAAREGATLRLGPAAERRIADGRALVEQWVAEERRIYGVTTGFGALSDVAISKKDTRRLQENILMSHAAGVGAPLDAEIVRAAMTLRVKDFARGHSGIRPSTLSALADLLNAGIVPVVPRLGSVGASGDLAPLAHMVAAYMGHGHATLKGARMDARAALAALYAGMKRYGEAMDELLEITRKEKDWKEGEAKRQLLALFNLAADQPELVSAYRKKLAQSLY